MRHFYPKIYGAKLGTDTPECNKNALVRRHAVRHEVCSKGHMDRIAENILVLVTSNMGENPIHRKHTVFFATLVSGELGDPKR